MIEIGCRYCLYANEERESCENPKVYNKQYWDGGVRLNISYTGRYYDCRRKEVSFDSIENRVFPPPHLNRERREQR